MVLIIVGTKILGPTIQANPPRWAGENSISNGLEDGIPILIVAIVVAAIDLLFRPTKTNDSKPG